MSTNKREARFRPYFKTPKGYLLVVLVLLMLIASCGAHDTQGLRNAAIAAGTGLVVDLFAALLQKRKHHLFSDGGVLTGLIIALVLTTNAPWYAVAVTTTVGLLSKHLLKIKRKPIFNPAAVGLLVATYAFTSGQSWWGGFAGLPAWSILVVIVGGYLITQRVNKFPQVFAFLGVYFLLQLIMGLWNVGDAVDALRDPFLNSALFLAFFMLTDPPTSPAKYGDQVWFGVLTAIISVLVYTVFGGLAYLLIGLLLANAWHAWRTVESRAGLTVVS